MNTKLPLFALGLLLICGLLATVAWAGDSASYSIDWQVTSGGGAPASSSGNVRLNATLGQTAIGPSSSSGYGLGVGYWYGPEQGYYRFLPLGLKRY